MYNECSIVRDLLPLYSEGLTSSETSSFVEQHLKNCETCKREYEALIANTDVSESFPAVESGELEEVKAIKKKVRRRINVMAFVLAAFILVAGTVVYLLMGGAVEGAKMKKQLDGVVFEQTDTGDHMIKTISFSGQKVYIEERAVIFDENGSVAEERILREHRSFYFVRKYPPGKYGEYRVTWLNKSGFFTGTSMRILVDSSGEPIGLENLIDHMSPGSPFVKIR